MICCGIFGTLPRSAHWFEAKRGDQHTGKAVSPMCYSPYFMHATREALVQRQLLQCRTCGSQAFHVLDCCRNPDYARVPTSPLGERLKAWLEAVQARMRASLFLTASASRRASVSGSPGCLGGAAPHSQQRWRIRETCGRPVPTRPWRKSNTRRCRPIGRGRAWPRCSLR